MKPILLLGAALLVGTATPAPAAAQTLSQIQATFDLLEKMATGSVLAGLRAARELVTAEDLVLKRVTQQRALGLLTVLRFVHRRELTKSLELELTSGLPADLAMIGRLRDASFRWIERARVASVATLKRLGSGKFFGLFTHLRAMSQAGWGHVQKVAEGATVHEASALERVMSPFVEKVRKAYADFQAWAMKHGSSIVREAFEETLLMLEEGALPTPRAPVDPPVAMR
jgi:hypothetical protein